MTIVIMRDNCPYDFILFLLFLRMLLLCKIYDYCNHAGQLSIWFPESIAYVFSFVYICITLLHLNCYPLYYVTYAFLCYFKTYLAEWLNKFVSYAQGLKFFKNT